MTITTLLSGLPARTMDQTTFDNAMASLMASLPTWGAQVNATAAGINTIAAGGAYAIPYVWGSAPNASNMLIGLTTAGEQNVASYISMSLTSTMGKNVSSQLDSMTAGATSAIKGQIRIIAQGDASKYLVFNATLYETNATYRDFAVACVDSSSASPFSTGDAVMLFFQRTGDKGAQGIQGIGFSNLVVIASTGAWTPPTGITKAEITVIDGGWSGGTVVSGSTEGGKGGDGGISIITVDPAVAYTATIGAGGAGPSAGTNTNPVTGGASSFSGSGITTLTTSNAALKVPGGSGFSGTGLVAGLGGSSLYAPAQFGAAVAGYGGGGYGAANGATGISGKAGAIIIRY